MFKREEQLFIIWELFPQNISDCLEEKVVENSDQIRELEQKCRILVENGDEDKGKGSTQGMRCRK
jgi:hypothetical protein